jgi:hypothetical protein
VALHSSVFLISVSHAAFKASGMAVFLFRSPRAFVARDVLLNNGKGSSNVVDLHSGSGFN